MKLFNRLDPINLIRLSLFATLLSLSACDNDSNLTITPPNPPPVMVSFDITITNLTNAQPLSPVAAVVHKTGFTSFEVGQAAGLGLEMIAESGMTADFIAEADAATENLANATGTAPIGPGASETITIEVDGSELDDLKLSALSMLVNTNDAFSGLNAVTIGDIAAGASETYYANAYDAGTEADTEATGTMPGPADGGEGFNADRSDDANIVTMHTGVVTRDDGLVSSALTQAHRFDNPVVMFTITRAP